MAQHGETSHSRPLYKQCIAMKKVSEIEIQISSDLADVHQMIFPQAVEKYNVKDMISVNHALSSILSIITIVIQIIIIVVNPFTSIIIIIIIIIVMVNILLNMEECHGRGWCLVHQRVCGLQHRAS